MLNYTVHVLLLSPVHKQPQRFIFEVNGFSSPAVFGQSLEFI